MSPPVQASVIRYDPDCNWSTIFWLQEPQKTAIYLFEPGAVVDDTVQPGTYDVGYA